MDQAALVREFADRLVLAPRPLLVEQARQGRVETRGDPLPPLVEEARQGRLETKATR